MSLIIAYVGKKGCVMASDKRRIAYFGNKENLKLLEDDLYDGKISSEKELYQKAEELDINIKITDDANKLNTVGETVVGEVSSKGAFETKRKRVYGTTNGYQIVELIGSEVTSRESGQKAVVLFGNKYVKSLAENLISKKWKSSQSLKYMGDIFEEILKEISRKTPTIGNQFDVLIKQPNFTPSQAQEHLDKTIDQDVKLLAKFRKKLQEDLDKVNESIELASKIVTRGEIGEVTSIDGDIVQVLLNDKTQAFDINWKQLAKPNDEVIMFKDGDDIKVGDKIIIDDEELCTKNHKTSLNCDIILCNL